MNRKLLVTLLRKNIEELNTITDGFMEMDEYPAVIINLAKRKTEDIQTIIDQLAFAEKAIEPVTDTTVTEVVIPLAEVEATVAETIGETKEDVQLPETEEIEQSLIPEEVSVEFAVETEPEAEIVTDLQYMAPEVVEPVAELKNEPFDILDVKVAEPKVLTIADKLSQQVVSINDTLAKNEDNLSATIANKKISDIKQAISIGDRFRFQRELFKSNGEDMNKTLSYLNQLATFDEAMSFLQSKYGWAEDNDAVADFIQILKRKFL
jgi:hypothetical protein